ncbi:hypothetical protein [Corynebacterium pseudopelargi]|uniref:Uncharacterized protein n=1 Tax=Corynebacterium pseudopelargi TaxID=2080757 RepID=A0A3G6ISZ1_9CORY|nr:hypothetical protein [Corynebacterium pseudopelargi]AZA08637.1 hypothetical protein CPPEL_02505 [Corynebacterium pseudopelargi]
MTDDTNDTTATPDATGSDTATGAGNTMQQASAGNNPHTPEAKPKQGESHMIERLRREAAGYRTKLREAEATLEARADTIRTVLGAQVREHVAGVAANVATLEALGFDPTAYVDPATGAVDLQRAHDDATALRDTHGLASADPVSDAAKHAAHVAGGDLVPPEVIRGATPEQMQAHAKALLEWVNTLVPFAPTVPGENAGSRPNLAPGAERWIQEAIQGKGL